MWMDSEPTRQTEKSASPHTMVSQLDDRDLTVVDVTSKADAVTAAKVAKQLVAWRHDAEISQQLAEVATELALHVLEHAGHGRLEFRWNDEGIELRASDKHEPVAAAPNADDSGRMRALPLTGVGVGRGLTAVRRYMDEIQLAVPEQGGLRLRAYRKF